MFKGGHHPEEISGTYWGTLNSWSCDNGLVVNRSENAIEFQSLTPLELQSRFGDNALKFQVICPQLSPKRDCGPKTVKSNAFKISVLEFVQKTNEQIEPQSMGYV